MISDSTLQYIVSTCFIHLDDRDESVQGAVYKFLMAATEISQKVVYEEAKASLAKQKFPRLCEQIIKEIELRQGEVSEMEEGG